MTGLDLFQVDVSVADVQIIEDEPIEGYWFRYEDSPGYDWQHPQIYRRQFRVIRETPCGVWLDDYGFERFVLNHARKRFAYPTIELAKNSFLIRKRKRIGYLAAQHDHAVAVLKMAEQHFGTPVTNEQ